MSAAGRITRRVLAGLAIAIVHFVVTTSAVFLVLGDWFGPRPEWVRIVGPIAAVIGVVLGLPAAAIPPAWIPHGMGGFFAVMFANSLLWGFVLVALWTRWRRRRRTAAGAP